jgi:hypothetical protein
MEFDASVAKTSSTSTSICAEQGLGLIVTRLMLQRQAARKRMRGTPSILADLIA